MKKLVAGVMIGIANVLPTVSGAAMAVLFNQYQAFLEVTGNFYLPKVWKKHFLLILGMIIGIILSILIIGVLYERYPFIIIFLFLGIIISGIFDLQTKLHENNLKNLLMMVLALVLMGWLSFRSTSLSLNVNNYLLLLIMGMVVGLATLLPGVGGSLLMMVLGIYFPILSGCKKILTDYHSWGSPEFWMIVIFSLGFIMGIIIFSSIIKKFMQRYLQMFNYLAFGMIIASGVALLWKIDFYQIEIMETFILLSALTFGFVGMGYLSKKMNE